jgi:chemotaxis protein methyltransferase CheR
MALPITPSLRGSVSPRENRAEEVEILLLLEGIFQVYGHDFRQYDPGILRDRILRSLRSEDVKSISQYQHRVLRDRSCLERLVEGLIAKPRPLFDPPGFWLFLRRKIIPVLRTYPSSRLWVAGCSSGEEAYALAILLHEEGLGSRAIVYATELDESMLLRAREGTLSSGQLESARARYRRSGGTRSLQRYLARFDGGHSFNGSFAGSVVFACHSLATDSSFNEFNVILCRRVLSLFAPSLQVRVRSLLHQSVGLFGYLGLGSGVSMTESPYAACYERIHARHRLFRRIR